MYFTQKWSTIFGMENILVLSIFIHKLGDGLIPKAKDLFWEIAVIVVTVVYQGRNGRLSIAALESNLWQAFAPWITTLCLLAGWHVYRAYQATRGEINRVEYQGTKKQRSQIIITDADGHTEPTKHPNYQLRLKGVVACCFAILSLCIAMSWRFAMKHPTKMTSDELVRHVFHPKIVKHVHKILEEHNAEPKAKKGKATTGQ